MKTVPNKIIFYDGDCGFCNQSVQFVLKYQKDTSIYFAAIQSSYCTNIFQNNKWERPDLSTLYFLEGKKLYSKSDAGISIAKNLKFPFSFAQFLWVVPQFLRDKVYDFIANRRHRLSNGLCVLPTKSERFRFLS